MEGEDRAASTVAEATRPPVIMRVRFPGEKCMPSWLRALVLATVVAWSLSLASDGRAGSSTVAVRLIAFNDFHGHLEPGENVIDVPDPTHPGRTARLRSGGAAYLATLIARLRAEQPHHLVVSSGDLIGASPLVSGLFHDEPTIEAMNAIGIDVNAVGNHEFDHGVAELTRIVRGGCSANDSAPRKSCERGAYDGARFAFLAANVIDRTTDRTIFEPTLVRTIDGVRIGFIGAVTRSTPGIVVPSGVAGVRFLAEARVLNEQAKALQAEGVRAIVAVVHEGGEADGGFDACGNPRGAIFEIERDLDPAIDVVLSAHTHRGYACTIRGRTVIQGASFGRLVSVVDLLIDRATGEVVRQQTRARNLPVPNGTGNDDRLNSAFPPLPAQPAIAAIVEHYRAAAAPLADRPVGRISAPFERRASAGGDHALGRLIADAHLAATRAGGARIAFTNPGGIRTGLYASGAGGTVTYGDAYATQPFGNSLVTMTLTGAQLKTLLEQQWRTADSERARILQPSAGFTYRWDGRRARGDRVEAIRLDGRPVAADDEVRVTVNSFLAAGGDGFRVLRDGRDRVGGPLDIDAFTAFLSEQSASGPLAPSSAPRISRAK
jgi:5'-nucleotidase